MLVILWMLIFHLICTVNSQQLVPGKVVEETHNNAPNSPNANDNNNNNVENKPHNVDPIKKSAGQTQAVNQAPTNNTESVKKNDSGLISVLPKGSGTYTIVESGALLRGFYVFLILSVLTIVYFIYRSYRLRHGNQPASVVRKYGILARRSDIEMRPLELDDEDDETLFEVGAKVNG